MSLSNEDIDETIKRYTQRFETYGYSPLTLGWNKGKQTIRFSSLLDGFDLKGKSILDIGCGFGDLNKTLQARYGQEYQYVGYDLVPALIDEARKRWTNSNVSFFCGEFKQTPTPSFDFAIGSGLFNHKLKSSEPYAVIYSVISAALNSVREAVSFDFLSTKVDFQLPHTHHSCPSKILELSYSLSRRLTLRNDYLPFEFLVQIHKNDQIDEATTCYTLGPKTDFPLQRQL